MCTWNGDFTLATWPVFQAWFDAFVTELKAWRWTITAEESLNSADQKIHFHAFVELKEAWKDDDIERLRFNGSLPNVQPNFLTQMDNLDGAASKGKAPRGLIRELLNAGHFYVYMKKPGSISSASNFPPFFSYTYVPSARRLDKWLEQKKLSENVYLEYMAELTIGFERRLRDVTAKRRYSALTKADDYNSPHQPVPSHALPPPRSPAGSAGHRTP